MFNTPCKNCTDTYKSCHTECSKYAQWKKEIEEYRQQICSIKSLRKESNNDK